MTDLAIIIVSFNTRDDLLRCLASLADDPPATPHEIAVVDNASTDGSAEAVGQRFPAVRVIQMGRNAGFSAANNRGIRETSSDLVLLLNSDTIARGTAIDRLVAEVRGNRAVAVAGPRIVDTNGEAELSFGPLPGPIAELRQRRLTRGAAAGRPAARVALERLTRRARRVDWVTAACLLVDRRDAEAAGLLDERYFLYFEDVDFCAAIRALGRDVRFVPEAEVVHLRGRSLATAPGLQPQAYRRSQLLFYAKHRPAWLPVLRLYLRLKGELPDVV